MSKLTDFISANNAFDEAIVGPMGEEEEDAFGHGWKECWKRIRLESLCFYELVSKVVAVNTNDSEA